MVRDRCNYFSFWAIFCRFTSQTARKIKILEIFLKSPGDIIILQWYTKNHDQMMYVFWDMVRDKCNCYFSFWTIFCPVTPIAAQKIKILRKWKKHEEISSFYICVLKIKIRWCTVPEIFCGTDGRKKWHIEVLAPPKNVKELNLVTLLLYLQVLAVMVTVEKSFAALQALLQQLMIVDRTLF